jgi:hypothetical protein
LVGPVWCSSSQSCEHSTGATLGIAEQTYYRWRKEYGALRVDQAKRLKDLEKENARLKKLVERGHSSGVLGRSDKSLFCPMEADREIRPTLGTA